MDIRIEDPEIAGRIKEFAAELTAAKAKRESIFRMSYARRLRAFLHKYPINEATGFLSWYEKPHYSYPLPLQCRNSVYEEYFHSKEDRPCVMRGSIYAMKWRRSIQWHMPDEVLHRFLRRKQFTFLYYDEWNKWLDKTDIIKRLDKKWGGIQKWNYCFVTAPHFRDDGDICTIILNGKVKTITQEKWNMIAKMDELKNKLSVQRISA